MLFASSFPDNNSITVSTVIREQSSNSKAKDLIIFIKIMATTDLSPRSLMFIPKETGYH